MQAVLVILLGQLVTEALTGDHVHQDRTAEVTSAAQGVLDGMLVVPVDRSQVFQAQVLEQDLRLKDVLQALLDPMQRLEQRGAD